MEQKLLQNIRYQLTEVLSRISGLDIRQRADLVRQDDPADLRMEIEQGGKETTLVVQIKSSGQPALIRNAARQLQHHIETDSGSYGVLGVPYLTARGIETCREEGVGCIDTAGNCLLEFENVYVEIVGKPNPAPADQEIRSIFSPKSSRVARVLLSDVGRWWGVREIATIAGINPGLVSRLKKQLVQRALAIEQNGAIRPEPSALLAAWLENYTYRRNGIREFYTLDSPADAERALVMHCYSIKNRCALGLFSGAALVAPHVRLNKAFAFVEADPDQIAEALGWKAVTSGANVMLLTPYDSGVFLQSRDVERMPVVSDIQLYLDLKSYRGRGVEAADFLFDNLLEPQWQRAANTSHSK